MGQAVELGNNSSGISSNQRLLTMEPVCRFPSSSSTFLPAPFTSLNDPGRRGCRLAKIPSCLGFLRHAQPALTHPEISQTLSVGSPPLVFTAT